MKRMGWVVLALAVVCFVSCSKKGPAGPAGSAGAQGSTGSTGAQGSTGSTGAAGIPRKMYVERAGVYVSNVTGWTRWFYNTTLPWTPATNGVITNFRGFTISSVGYEECFIDSVAVSGRSVTVSGIVWGDATPFDCIAYFDVIAYDTLTTMLLVDKTPSNIVGFRKHVGSSSKTNLP